jgi:hypothetical protein
MDFAQLSAAVKFGAAHVYGSPEAGGLAHAVAHGDSAALGALADYLEENGHPAADLVRRVHAGEGVEGNFLDQDSLGIHATPNRPDSLAKPTHLATNSRQYVGDGRFEDAPGHGSLFLRYFHLPDDRHYLHFYARDADNVARRSWLLPTTADEVRGLADTFRDRHQGGTLFNDFAEELDHAVAHEPEIDDGQHQYLDHRLARAGVPAPLQPAEQFARAVEKAADARTTAEKLLHVLAREHPGELLNTAGNSHLRLVAADAMDEEGREQEARLLRSTDPVGVHRGKVYSGRYDSLDPHVQEYVRTVLELSPHGMGSTADYFEPHEIHPSTLARLNADYSDFSKRSEQYAGELSPTWFHQSRNDQGGFSESTHLLPEARADKLHRRAAKYGPFQLTVSADGNSVR